MFFSFESFKGFFKEDPSYLQGIPPSDQKFVFGISFNAARNVAESKVKSLSEL